MGLALLGSQSLSRILSSVLVDGSLTLVHPEFIMSLRERNRQPVKQCETRPHLAVSADHSGQPSPTLVCLAQSHQSHFFVCHAKIILQKSDNGNNYLVTVLKIQWIWNATVQSLAAITLLQVIQQHPINLTRPQ